MIIIALTIFILVISVVVHEVAHGWVAYKLGDQTAKSMGRLTLNPISHIDPFYTILMPILTFISFGFALGGAKPVPYNPYNLSDQKYGGLKVALGGPAANFILAVIFGLVARFIPFSFNAKIGLISAFFSQDFGFLLEQMHGSILASIFVMSIIFCFYNLLLMAFNLTPVPPLDGSKVLMPFLPYEWQVKFHRLEPYGLLILIALLYYGFFSFIMYIVVFFMRLIIGF